MRRTIIKSDLKRLVENTLNEMDWKTYANASRARRAQGRDKSSDDLSDYSAKRFNDTYSDEDFEMADVNPNGVEGRYDSMYPWGMDNERGFYGDDFEEGIPFDELDLDDDEFAGRNDAANYVGGKSKYVKGKGWTNESRRRRMVNNITESVIRRLRGRRPSRWR